MGSIWDDTIEGFNKFIKDQQKVPGDATLSLTQFDDEYEPNFMDVPLDEVPMLNRQNYQPRGGTALYDAIGKSIADFEQVLSDRKKPDQVLFVIITDGMENRSREMSQSAVKSLLENKFKNDKWQFVYIGANQDAITTARQFGGRSTKSGSASFYATKAGVANTFAALSSSTARHRASGQSVSANYFTDDERNAMTSDVEVPDSMTAAGFVVPDGSVQKSGVVTPKKKVK